LPHFSPLRFSSRFFLFRLMPLCSYPNALPHCQHDNDICSIFSRTRNKKISGSISINNLQRFRVPQSYSHERPQNSHRIQLPYKRFFRIIK
jgi:hypothetical protein